MKNFLCALSAVFVFSGMALAIEVAWITLTGDNKEIELETLNIKPHVYKDEKETLSYMVRIAKNKEQYICGAISFCQKEEDKNLVEVLGVKSTNNSSLIKDENGKFAKPTGAIKLAHDYVCGRYFANLKQYEIYTQKAEELANNDDYKNAIKQYNFALSEAMQLSDKGYSQARVANTLFAIGELSEKHKKYAVAKSSYQGVLKLNKLKDLSYIEKANEKIATLPEIKGEKAKEVAGGIFGVLGVVGLTTLNALLGGN